jgi:low temperature requirement protein LtrA
MTTCPFFKPVRLWSAEPGASRRVTWLELFFDVIFVAAVAQVAVALGEDYSLHGLLRFAFMFLLVWWAWLGHTMYNTRFDAEDVVQRLLTLVQIFAAAAMAANAKSSFDSRDSAGFGAAYAAMRFVLVVQYWRARRAPETRAFVLLHAAGFGTAAVLWAVAAVVPTPLRFWIWGAALLIDLATPWLALDHSHRFPPDAEHLPERFGLFTIILLGESVAAVMRGMESQEGWPVSAAIAAFLGMALAFGYWWWYFDAAQGAAERHLRSAKDLMRFHLWSYVHFPLYLSIAVTGVGVEHVVSLPAGAHLHREDAWILVGAAFILMTALTTIGLTSPRITSRRAVWIGYGLCALALPGPWVAASIPPFLFVVWLAALCVIQVAFVTRNQRAEKS